MKSSTAYVVVGLPFHLTRMAEPMFMFTQSTHRTARAMTLRGMIDTFKSTHSCPRTGQTAVHCMLILPNAQGERAHQNLCVCRSSRVFSPARGEKNALQNDVDRTEKNNDAARALPSAAAWTIGDVGSSLARKAEPDKGLRGKRTPYH